MERDVVGSEAEPAHAGGWVEVIPLDQDGPGEVLVNVLVLQFPDVGADSALLSVDLLVVQ